MNKKYIVEYNDTGICIVDTKWLVKYWKIKWSISQYGEKYTLLANCKIQISKEQALEIIKSVPLFGKKSTVFSSGTSWITESFKLSEIERLTPLSNRLYYELKSLEDSKPII